jgi:hypothetical protein
MSIYSGTLIFDPNSIRQKDISFLFISSISIGILSYVLKFYYISGGATANTVVVLILVIRMILKRKGWM